MNEVREVMSQMTIEMLIDLWIAVGIFLCFLIFRSGLSYGIIKLCKIKVKDPKKIKRSAFYQPLRSFFTALGVYLAIWYLKEPFQISENTFFWVTRIFKLIVIITTANGLANSKTLKEFVVKKLKDHTSQNRSDVRIQFIIKIMKTILYIIAGILCLAELGFNLSGLLAGVGIGGVILTLAAQDTAKNLFGGMMILLDKPFVVGDYIQFGGQEGTVEDITFRSTRVRTLENAVLHIPNAVIVGSSLINCTQMEKRRFQTILKLDQKTPLEKMNQLKEKIQTVLEKQEYVISDSIIIKFDAIYENGMNLLVCAYIDEVEYTHFLEIKEAINYQMMEVIRKEGIQLTNNCLGSK